MRIGKKILAGIMMICILAGMTPAVSVMAADAKVSIALSASSVKEGDSVTVTVTVKCADAIGSYAMAVTYDSSVIEYTGGSGSGGGGTVNIAGYGDGSVKSLKATLKFKAVGSGQTTVQTTGGEAYTWDEAAASLVHAGAKVTVGTPETASTVNTLSALSVSPGTLSPAFDPSTTKYTVSVGADVSQLVVSATAKDDKAKVSVSGNKKLKAGQNTIKVKVTAESGAGKTYQIICTRAAAAAEEPSSATQSTTASEEPAGSSETTTTTQEPEMTTQEQTAAPTILMDGVTYTFATDTEEIAIPDGFTRTTAQYQGQDIVAYAGPEQALMLVCLLTPEGDQVWFLYEEETGGLLAYCDVKTEANRLLIMEAPDSVVIPESYRSVELDMQGTRIPGYINESSAEIILVYAKKLTGEAGLYYYDTIENGFVRYIQPQTEEEATTQEAAPVMAEPSSNPLSGKVSFDTLCRLLAVVSLVCVASLLTLVATWVSRARLRRKQADMQAEEMVTPEVESRDKKVAIQVDTRTKEQKLEQKAAEVVAKLALDEEQEQETDPALAKPTTDTAPMPTIHIEDTDTIS